MADSTHLTHGQRAIVNVKVSEHYRNLPLTDETHPFHLFPGSKQAREKGCPCPRKQDWPNEVRLDSTCPVHRFAKPGN